MDAESAHARQFKRHETRFEATIEPHSDHADQLRLSYSGAGSGLAVIDVSKGGLGLRSGVYLPRNLRVTLHIAGVGDKEGEHATSAKAAARKLTVRAVVRRCSMLDHKPTYQVGLQFLDPVGRDEQALNAAVTATAQDKAAGPPASAKREESALCAGGADVS